MIESAEQLLAVKPKKDWLNELVEFFGGVEFEDNWRNENGKIKNTYHAWIPYSELDIFIDILNNLDENLLTDYTDPLRAELQWNVLYLEVTALLERFNIDGQTLIQPAY